MMQSSATRKQVPPKRILVVDDEPPVAETIRLVLTSSGHAVEVAVDAQQALGLYRAGKFDLVITDFSLPGMDGLDLAREVKRLCTTQPIIMITAYAQMMASDGETVPNIDFLMGKPFSVHQMREMLEKLFPAR
jgi:CheY-like chemotaxis protein